MSSLSGCQWLKASRARAGLDWGRIANAGGTDSPGKDWGSSRSSALRSRARLVSRRVFRLLEQFSLNSAHLRHWLRFSTPAQWPRPSPCHPAGFSPRGARGRVLCPGPPQTRTQPGVRLGSHLNCPGRVLFRKPSNASDGPRQNPPTPTRPSTRRSKAPESPLHGIQSGPWDSRRSPP